jgi:hypothetical protein
MRNSVVYNPFIYVLAGCLISIVYNPSEIRAQSSWRVSIHSQYVHPAGSLGNWFSPTTASYGFALSRGGKPGWLTSLRVEKTEFTRGNKCSLTYDDLDLNLKMYAARLDWRYDPFKNRRHVKPFLTWDIGLYRWYADRGAYDLTDPETGSTIYVPSRNQRDWSWGGGIGAGAEFSIMKHFGVAVSMKYRIIIGELWPALALDLENVSGFQMIDTVLSLAYRF